MATADVQNPTAALTEEAPAVETPVAAEEVAKTEEAPAPAEAEVEAPAPVEVEEAKEEAPAAAETEETKEAEPAAAAEHEAEAPAVVETETKEADGQLAAINTFKQCDSSVPSFGVSCFKQRDLMDSDLDLDSLSYTSTSSDHSVTDTGIYYSSNEDEDLMPELSWQKHGSVNEFGALSQPVKDTTMGDDDDLCFASPESLSTVRKKDAGRQRQCRAAYNTKMAPLSFWPRWVYNMYDSYSLARRAADLWNQIIAEPGMDGYVRKPDILSFLIGSRLPVSASMRQELLDIDGVSYRLQREIQLLKAFNLVRCRNCLALIARRSDMVVPSSVDPCGAHVMPLLYNGAQEVITVHNTSGLALNGNPSSAHSWFPGYTWTIALCAACESNIGWLFRADKKNLLPKSFWGVRISQTKDGTQSAQDRRSV